MLFGVVCDLLNLFVTFVTCLFFPSCYMPRRKTGTPESSGHVRHALSSVRDQLLSWPLHPGYWMSRGMNRRPLWRFAGVSNTTRGWCLAASLSTRVGLLSPMLHPGYWVSRVGSVGCTTAAISLYACLVVSQGERNGVHSAAIASSK